MEIRDIYYIITLIGIAITGIVWVRDQNAQRKGENDLVKQDLANHKENHKALEKRVTEHESKVEQKLESISDKVDDLKSLIIERIK